MIRSRVRRPKGRASRYRPARRSEPMTMASHRRAWAASAITWPMVNAGGPGHRTGGVDTLLEELEDGAVDQGGGGRHR